MKDKLLTIFNTYGKSSQVSKLLEEVMKFKIDRQLKRIENKNNITQ